jgi:hypothetical protein
MPFIWEDVADEPLTFGRDSLQPPPGGDFTLWLTQRCYQIQAWVIVGLEGGNARAGREDAFGIVTFHASRGQRI